MNVKLEKLLQWFREGLMRILQRYPVEVLLVVYSCVGCLVSYEQEDSSWGYRLALAPLFAILALAVNNLAGMSAWRRIYWVCWMPIIPLSCWAGLDAWLETSSAAITFGVLAPLSLLLCRLAIRNERFVCDAIIWLRSGVLAVLFANVALGLFCAILYSTTYIFGLSGEWIEHVMMYALILTETLVTPVLFLMMADHWRDAECLGNRIVDVLVNYIVTPALLIYTAILYLYMAKILVSWELPRGGVAYLVFGFTLTALIVKAMQCLLQKRLYDWYFDRFSLISLPTQVLFWVGTLRRIDEYGITTPRVYLLVCGALMTLCAVLFLSRKVGRYYWVVSAALLLFALMAYVPGLRPDRLSASSQVHRATRLADRLNLLSDTGALRLDLLEKADTTQSGDLHKLYESLDYIEVRDSDAFARFGLTQMSDFSDRLPAALYSTVVNGRDQDDIYADKDPAKYLTLNASDNRKAVEVEEYKYLYDNIPHWGNTKPVYSFDSDTLRIVFGDRHPDFVITGSDLLAAQLLKIGYGEALPNPAQIEEKADQVLNYADDEVMVLFSDMNLVFRDSVWQVSDVSVGVVLTK